MGYSVRVTEHAHDDLAQIISYIVDELSNPPAALTLLSAVEHVYEKLARNRCFRGAGTEKHPSADT